MGDNDSSFQSILRDDEELVKVVHRHFSSQLKYVFIFLMVLIVPFFILFPLVRWSLWGVVIFFALIFFAFLYGWRRFMMARSSVLLITSERLIDIDRKGFFNKIVTECRFPMIHDVTWQQKGVWATLFQTGTLDVQTTGGSHNIEIPHVYQPQEVRKLIRSFQEEGGEEGSMVLSEALALLENMRFRLGEEKFQKLLKLVHENRK